MSCKRLVKTVALVSIQSLEPRRWRARPPLCASRVVCLAVGEAHFQFGCRFFILQIEWDLVVAIDEWV